VEPTTSAPDTVIVWIALLLVSFAINFTAIVVAIYLWGVRPEPSDDSPARAGYVVVLALAALLAVATVLEVIGTIVLPTSAIETLSIGATLGQLPISFAVFAFAIYRRRPRPRDPR
jgi:hypothetical protein